MSANGLKLQRARRLAEALVFLFIPAQRVPQASVGRLRLSACRCWNDDQNTVERITCGCSARQQPVRQRR